MNRLQSQNPLTQKWQRLLGSLPVGFTALCFLVPVFGDGKLIPGADLNLLTTAMQIEWLVIGGGLLYMPFLMIPVKSRVGFIIRAVACFLLTMSFGLGAHTMSGWPGVFSFYTLLIVGYGGSVFFIRDPNRNALLAIEFLLRWLACLVLFFSLFVYFDAPQNIESWQGNSRLLPYGAAFFSALFLLEFAVYSWAFPKLNSVLLPGYADSGLNNAAIDTRQARQKFYDAIRNK